MQISNAAVARGHTGSQVGFGTGIRTERKDFTGCNSHTAEVVEIAASKDTKFTAGAGFAFAVS